MALKNLQEEGLIEPATSARGTSVNEQPERRPDRLHHAASFARNVSPRDIMNMRLIIEPQAAAAAASRPPAHPTSRSFARLTIRRMLQSRWKRSETWDMEFHKRIFVSTRNEFSQQPARHISVQIRQRQPMVEIRRAQFQRRARRRADCEQHKEIFRALQCPQWRGRRERHEMAHLLARSQKSVRRLRARLWLEGSAKSEKSSTRGITCMRSPIAARQGRIAKSPTLP